MINVEEELNEFIRVTSSVATEKGLKLANTTYLILSNNVLKKRSKRFLSIHKQKSPSESLLLQLRTIRILQSSQV